MATPASRRIVAHVEDFNGILRRLTADLAVRYPADATVDRAKKRIMMAIDVDPVFIIDNVGPYLYQYRNEIYAGDTAFFVTNSYDAELKQSVNAEKADLVSYIIPKVKEAWGVVGPEQQAAYLDTVQTLLDAYVEYLTLKVA